MTFYISIGYFTDSHYKELYNTAYIDYYQSSIKYLYNHGHTSLGNLCTEAHNIAYIMNIEKAFTDDKIPITEFYIEYKCTYYQIFRDILNRASVELSISNLPNITKNDLCFYIWQNQSE